MRLYEVIPSSYNVRGETPEEEEAAIARLQSIRHSVIQRKEKEDRRKTADAVRRVTGEEWHVRYEDRTVVYSLALESRSLDSQSTDTEIFSVLSISILAAYSKALWPFEAIAATQKNLADNGKGWVEEFKEYAGKVGGFDSGFDDGSSGDHKV